MSQDTALFSVRRPREVDKLLPNLSAVLTATVDSRRDLSQCVGDPITNVSHEKVPVILKPPIATSTVHCECCAIGVWIENVACAWKTEPADLSTGFIGWDLFGHGLFHSTKNFF